MKKRYRVSREVKEQILGRIKNDGVSVADAAKEHGLSEQTIYNWLGAGVEGRPTYGEISRLKRENAELKQLVGEITLKLSETQKRGDGTERRQQGRPREAVLRLTPELVLSLDHARA